MEPSECPSKLLEMAMDFQLSRQLHLPPQQPPTQRRKGTLGRRPLRPNDPIKKKTEELDKFWLRAFRGYMEILIPQIESSICPDQLEFLAEYLSAEGRPGKGSRFLSYGRKYKDYLFSHRSFAYLFHKWFLEQGKAELRKKCVEGSDRWFVFYDYAYKNLLFYQVTEN